MALAKSSNDSTTTDSSGGNVAMNISSEVTFTTTSSFNIPTAVTNSSSITSIIQSTGLPTSTFSTTFVSPSSNITNPGNSTLAFPSLGNTSGGLTTSQILAIVLGVLGLFGATYLSCKIRNLNCCNKTNVFVVENQGKDHQGRKKKPSLCCSLLCPCCVQRPDPYPHSTKLSNLNSILQQESVDSLSHFKSSEDLYGPLKAPPYRRLQSAPNPNTPLPSYNEINLNLPSLPQKDLPPLPLQRPVPTRNFTAPAALDNDRMITVTIHDRRRSPEHVQY